MTKRPTLAEFSLEWRENDIKGQKLEANKHAAYDDHRRLQAAPVEDHTARIEKISNGEAVAPYTDRDSLIRAAANRCHDMKEACELHHKRSQPIKHKELRELGKKFLPEERAILKRIASGLVEAIAGAGEYRELKDYFVGEGGCVGICLSNHENVTGHPRDRNSDLAILLKEFVAIGVLDKMPKSLA